MKSWLHPENTPARTGPNGSPAMSGAGGTVPQGLPERSERGGPQGRHHRARHWEPARRSWPPPPGPEPTPPPGGEGAHPQ
eukprot:4526761-Alexandrium_andersonii.AAC.1